MMHPAIGVFEKQPRWCPELRRQLAGEPVEVRACRATDDLLPMVPESSFASESSLAVVILDLREAWAECLQFLGQTMQRSSRPPVVVLSSDRTAELQWPMRELGALAFLGEDVSGEALARLCRRQWNRDG